MAKKSSARTGETKVTRIKASDGTRTPARPLAKDPITKEKRTDLTSDEGLRNPLSGVLGYFTGAWNELRQVRWPNRSATWSMTGALLLFTGFFVVFILLLDAGFKYLFQILLGK